MNNQLVSIIASVYNEEKIIVYFHEELIREIANINNYHFEILFINDGSIDQTKTEINKLAKQDDRVKAVHLSRNFGHEAAMTAGLDVASGDALIFMDSDLQHPPALIPEMIRKYREGHDIITMVRSSRKDGGLVKKICSKLFYKILNMLSDLNFEPDASDFFLLSRKAADIIKNNYSERIRFFRGIIQSIGLKRNSLQYIAPARKGGKSKYDLLKLFFLFLSAIISYSKKPLRISIFIGLLFAFFSIVIAVYTIIMKILSEPFSGYTTIVLFLCLSFSLQFFIIGIFGEYLGNLFIESKKRPVYIVDEQVNIEIRK